MWRGVGRVYLGVESPPPYLSLLYQSTALALAINKEDIDQKSQVTAAQLPDTPASPTLTHRQSHHTTE